MGLKTKYKLIAIIVLLIIAIYLLKTQPKEYLKENNEEEEMNIPIDERTLTLEDGEFWISKIQPKDQLLMNSTDIEEYNKRSFQKEESLMDLREHEASADKEDILSLIQSLSKVPKEERYDSNGNLMDKDFYNHLISNMNLDSIEDRVHIQYGIAINRTMIRTFPTFETSYNKKDDYQFDRFMETAIYPWEPLILYWESRDGLWYFGRTYNYIGWIPKEDVALGDRDEIFHLTHSQDFLMVIDRQISIDDTLYDMGVRIPLIDEGDNSYRILIPKKGDKDNLFFIEKELAKSNSLHQGYLPYTKENILLQAFKFKDEEYGWGGMNNTRDCSAFIMDIHRSFGIMLPRNTIDQGKNNIGKLYDFSSMRTLGEGLEALETLPPASILYMPGHTMLYLGQHEGKHYMIHQFAGYYEETEGGLKYISVMKTAVTPVDIKASSEKTYIEMVYLAKEYIP